MPVDGQSNVLVTNHVGGDGVFVAEFVGEVLDILLAIVFDAKVVNC